MTNRHSLAAAALARARGALCLLLVTAVGSGAVFPGAAESAAPDGALVSGVVFVDADGDGVRDAGELPRVGVAVTNGRDVVVTGADGGYSLAWREPGFVTVTCPADARCPVWFHRRSAAGFDFALVPAEAEPDFFFVHVSDAHVYPRVEDMAALLQDKLSAWYLPRVLVGWGLLRAVDRMLPEHSPDEIAAGLREVVAPYRSVAGTWDATVMMDYVDLALDPATGLVEPALEIPHAFGEVAGLGAAFVVETGDMVLEGNNGSPEAIESWYRYYLEVTAADGVDPYETIGNNELAGTARDDFPPGDPRYGKALYWKYLGPNVYSFDRGPFHFASLDTHRPLFDTGDPDADEEWSFYEMDDATRQWLDADLSAARAAGRILVVLNHEPLFYDPAWDFDDPTPADDQGLLAKHEVAYTLSGHIHRNGFQDAPPGGGTTHITTGALSGFRWVLPVSIDNRGYRVFYAREGRLYSAWKRTDERLLGFVSPRSIDEAAIHPASTHAPAAAAVEGMVEVVAVGVDVDRPFASLSLWLADEPLETERWGDYFVHARLDSSRIPGATRLELRARSQDGKEQAARIEVRQASAAPPGSGG